MGLGSWAEAKNGPQRAQSKREKTERVVVERGESVRMEEKMADLV